MLQRCQTPALLKVTKHQHGHAYVALTRLQIDVCCQSVIAHVQVKRHCQLTVLNQSFAMAPAVKLECSGFVEVVSES